MSTAGDTAEVAPFVGFACVARYRVPLVCASSLFEEGNGISLAAADVEANYPSLRTVSPSAI